jgi:hypothetical protein
VTATRDGPPGAGSSVASEALARAAHSSTAIAAASRTTTLERIRLGKAHLGKQSGVDRNRSRWNLVYIMPVCLIYASHGIIPNHSLKARASGGAAGDFFCPIFCMM